MLGLLALHSAPAVVCQAVIAATLDQAGEELQCLYIVRVPKL